MNKILHLFDEQYVNDLFNKEILPLYPDFVKIKKIKIKTPKKYIWETTYHVVIEFETTFITKDKKEKKLPIYCTAHSEEPRKNVFKALKYLWDNSFSKGYLSIPRPLFYSNYFKGTFYRGVKGGNLYQYIREKKYKEIESIVIKAAGWFAKLHSLPTENAINFNKENSRIETVIPGIAHILNDIRREYPKYLDAYTNIYSIINNKEKEFLASTDRRWFVHGDAHPENIIKMSPKKIGVIDFTDLCLSDFTRDIGAFLQQLEFMCNRKIKNKRYIKKINKIFLKNYFNNAKIKLDSSIQGRIENYYYWTAMRTATYFLIKDNPKPERGYPVINEVCRKLGVKL